MMIYILSIMIITIDKLHAFRNTCSVSYWRSGWYIAAAKAGKAVVVREVNHDIKLPFGEIHPYGSGRGGRVRMGDEMRESDFLVECQESDAPALKAAHDDYIKSLLA